MFRCSSVQVFRGELLDGSVVDLSGDCHFFLKLRALVLMWCSGDWGKSKVLEIKHSHGALFVLCTSSFVL